MAVDLSQVIKKYKGKWVALKDDEKTVVATGKTVKEALESAKKNGFQKPILFRVPTRIMPYIGSFGL